MALLCMQDYTKFGSKCENGQLFRPLSPPLHMSYRQDKCEGLRPTYVMSVIFL